MKIEGACHPVISVCPFKAKISHKPLFCGTHNFLTSLSHRNTMEKMFPNELHERYATLESEDTKLIMQEFEDFGQELEKRARNPGVVHGRAKKGFLWGMLTTLGVVFVSTINSFL